ncbi:stage II sporulation protein P [Bacillus andreraoultii]|uniref:stage II sporulation protein P n=1 Tax=Bacillus andreraoultii TaxID=1499685 RepID=UPI00053AB178|nr:stage II sporulation protein P [Bacillus andreraoultii]
MKQIIKILFFLFSLISVASAVISSQTNLFFSSFLLHESQEGKSDSTNFLKMIASENHYYSTLLPDEGDSLFTNAIEIATNVNIKDVRSLIFDEVPGLFSMTSDIVIAGEGTDFTNLPIESSPPIEEVLKDREIAEDSLNKIEKEEPKQPIKKPEKNTVFIYHSHSRESFIPHLKGVNNANGALHKDVNITLVGERLSKKLEEKGIGSVVDKTDIPELLAKEGLKYSRSYQASREVVKEALAQNHDLSYLIDVHRDSAKRETTTTQINGKNYAKLYFIVGKAHPNYKQNEKIAVELNRMIKKKYGSLTRGVYRKDKTEGNGIYNQDLSPNAFLIEVGGPENTLEEMYNTVDVLADIFADYYFKNTDAIEVNK